LAGGGTGYIDGVASGRPALDVLTLNLWGANGPARARMERLAAWLRRERPDIVLLQEVEHLDGSAQAELLARAAGYNHIAEIRTARVAGEGLAVLSGHPVHALPPLRLPLAALDHPRAVQQVDVVTPSGSVRVANTHLAWRLNASAARRKQARALLRALAASGRPVVLGGDLNDVPGSGPLRALAQAGFADCCVTARPPITFDCANEFLWQHELAGRRVDHVLARGLALGQARVVLNGADGPIVSDHYGVRAELRWPARRSGPPP
jgi:endonuclease/exonuclease/phosphatase family metal-dependent hydrolase